MPKKLFLHESSGIRIAVLFDTVTISLICKDGYEAQVLFEDLAERLVAGETIGIEAVKR